MPRPARCCCQLLLLLVLLLAENRERLSEHFLLPLLADETLAAVADKATFSELCTEIGVPTPRTVVLDFTGGSAPEVPELDLGWPVVAKPSRSSAYTHVSFPGKRKVFEMRSRAELEDEITVTVMHEVGHFFGIEEDRLHELGWG